MILLVFRNLIEKHHSVRAMLGYWCDDYVILRCDRDRRAGRYCFLLRSTLSYSIVTESIGMGYEIIAVDIFFQFASFRVVLPYRPPSCSQSLTNRLVKAISYLTASPLQVIVDDLNFPDIDWKCCNTLQAKTHLFSICCHVTIRFCISLSPVDAKMSLIFC